MATTSSFPSTVTSHYPLRELIQTIHVRKRFFIQDSADNFECEKGDVVHLIVFHCKKIHFCRNSRSFKRFVNQSFIFVFLQLKYVAL